MQNVVGPTLVAMATNFGLGAEIQSPTGLLKKLTYMATCYKFKYLSVELTLDLTDTADIDAKLSRGRSTFTSLTS